MTTLVRVQLKSKCPGKNVDVIVKDANGNEVKAHTLRNGPTTDNNQCGDWWEGNVYDGQEVVTREVNE
jgi:hypothetical protein